MKIFAVRSTHKIDGKKQTIEHKTFTDESQRDLFFGAMLDMAGFVEKETNYTYTIELVKSDAKYIKLKSVYEFFDPRVRRNVKSVQYDTYEKVEVD